MTRVLDAEIIDQTHSELADKAVEGYRMWLRKYYRSSSVDNAMCYMLTTEGLKMYGDIPGRELPMASRVLALRA